MLEYPTFKRQFELFDYLGKPLPWCPFDANGSFLLFGLQRSRSEPSLDQDVQTGQ